MSKYLGSIRPYNEHYNFRPIKNIDNNQINDLTEEENAELISKSDYRNIEILDFTKSYIGRKYEEWFKRNNELLCVIDINWDDVKSSDILRKIARIDGTNLFIQTPNECGIYRVVKYYSKTDFEKEENYRVDTEEYPKYEKEEIYFQDGRYLYGRYTYSSYASSQGWVPVDSGFIKKYNLLYLNDKKYIFSQDITNGETIDVLPRSTLWNNLINMLNRQNIQGGYNEIINTIKNNSKEYPYIEKRKDTLVQVLKDNQETWATLEDYQSDLVKLITNNIDKEPYRSIIEKIIQQESVLNTIREHSEYIQRINELKSNIDELEKRKNELQGNQPDIYSDIDNLDRDIKNKIQEKQGIEDEIKKLQNKLQEIMDEHKDLNDIIDRQAEIKKLNKERENLLVSKGKTEEEMATKKKRYEDYLKEIEKEFSEKSKDIIKKMEPFMDAAIEKQVIKLVNIQNKKESDTQYDTFVSSYKSKIQQEETNVKELVEKIVERVQGTRPTMERNEIINLLLCIKTGMFTVFSGTPGVGKTSLCDILGKSMGLNSFGDTPGRYISVSVEKGWTNKKDFIGYYNPLTDDIVCNNKDIYDAFRIMDKEWNDNLSKSFPFWILLDEANLSPMEYYLSDFINVCNLKNTDRYILLGDGEKNHIGCGLRFLATINNDHTTEMLSPRMIDRSWIIHIKNSNKDIVPDNQLKDNDFNPMFNDWFTIDTKHIPNDNEQSFQENENYKKFIICSDESDILSIYGKLNITISYRTKEMIDNYLFNSSLFESQDPKELNESNNDYIDTALDFCIAQKILPQINGFGEDYKTYIDELCNKLPGSMIRSRAILNNIISSAESTHQYNFFLQK